MPALDGVTFKNLSFSTNSAHRGWNLLTASPILNIVWVRSARLRTSSHMLICDKVHTIVCRILVRKNIDKKA